MPLHFHFHLMPSFKTKQNKTKIPSWVVSTPLTEIISRKIFTQQLFFSPPEWVCLPSGLNQQSIKDKTNKSRSPEVSFWSNTRRNLSTWSGICLPKVRERTVSLLSQNRGGPPAAFTSPFGNRKQNMCSGSKPQNTRVTCHRVHCTERTRSPASSLFSGRAPRSPPLCILTQQEKAPQEIG